MPLGRRSFHSIDLIQAIEWMALRLIHTLVRLTNPFNAKTINILPIQLSEVPNQQTASKLGYKNSAYLLAAEGN